MKKAIITHSDEKTIKDLAGHRWLDQFMCF